MSACITISLKLLCFSLIIERLEAERVASGGNE